MIEKKDILKMVKAVIRHDKGYPDRRLMHPQRDWFIGLMLFTVTILLGSLYAGNTFLRYQHINTDNGDSGKSIPVYREAIVQDAINLYHTRNENYQMLLEKVQMQVDISSQNTATSTASTSADIVETTDINTGSDTNGTIQTDPIPDNLGEIQPAF